eukprot:540719-Amphidinium_carterae.1
MNILTLTNTLRKSENRTPKVGGQSKLLEQRHWFSPVTDYRTMLTERRPRAPRSTVLQDISLVLFKAAMLKAPPYETKLAVQSVAFLGVSFPSGLQQR